MSVGKNSTANVKNSTHVSARFSNYAEIECSYVLGFACLYHLSSYDIFGMNRKSKR